MNLINAFRQRKVDGLFVAHHPENDAELHQLLKTILDLPRFGGQFIVLVSWTSSSCNFFGKRSLPPKAEEALVLSICSLMSSFIVDG